MEGWRHTERTEGWCVRVIDALAVFSWCRSCFRSRARPAQRHVVTSAKPRPPHCPQHGGKVTMKIWTYNICVTLLKLWFCASLFYHICCSVLWHCTKAVHDFPKHKLRPVIKEHKMKQMLVFLIHNYYLHNIKFLKILSTNYSK